MGIVIALLVIIILIMLFGREGFLGMIGGTFKIIGVLLFWGTLLLIVIIIIVLLFGK